MSLVNLVSSFTAVNINLAAAKTASDKTKTDKSKKKVKKIPFGTDEEIYAISKNKAACIQFEGDDIKTKPTIYRPIMKLFEKKGMTMEQGKCENHGYKVKDKTFKGKELGDLDITVTIWLN